MRKCGQCGGRLRRVHRTFWERFRYMAIFECKDCEHEEVVPRRYLYHFGPPCRCPKCGTLRVVRLKERDRIDPLNHGFLNLMERLAGGKLFHCRYCRIQFFDRRKLSGELESAEPPEDHALTTPQDTAKSDA
jgi:hypothetical protein